MNLRRGCALQSGRLSKSHGRDDGIDNSRLSGHGSLSGHHSFRRFECQSKDQCQWDQHQCEDCKEPSRIDSPLVSDISDIGLRRVNVSKNGNACSQESVSLIAIW